MEISETDPRDVIKIKEKEPTTLAERVQRIEDKIAIMTLMAEYATMAHAGGGAEAMKAVGWALFTEDVDYIIGGTTFLRSKGADGLRGRQRGKGFPRAPDGKIVSVGPDTKFRHLMSLPVIRVSDDGKEAWVAMHFSGMVTRFDGIHNDKHSHEGTYIHHLVKTPDGWRINKFVNNSEQAHNPLVIVVE